VGQKSNAYRDLVGKTERIRPRLKSRRRWEDNIEKDFKETGWEFVA
jgi:hypothetical protein